MMDDLTPFELAALLDDIERAAQSQEAKGL